MLAESVEQHEPPPELRQSLMATVHRGGRWRDARAGQAAPFAALGLPAAPRGRVRRCRRSIAATEVGYRVADGSESDPAETIALSTQASGMGGDLVVADGEATLHMHDVEQLDKGAVYQVWVSDQSGVKPSAAFVPHEDGTATAAVPEAAGDATELMITREPRPGRTTPTLPAVARPQPGIAPAVSLLAVAEHCYRHPNRETGVSCSNCGKPICPECMTSTPVGMRCPDCARQRTRVASAAAIGAKGGEPIATYALLALNVIVFLAEVLSGGGGAASVEGGGNLLLDGGTCGNAVSDGGPCAIEGVGVVVSDGGELFRLITGGFLHAGPFHILLNMFALYVLGTLIEPIIGTARFLGIYFAALLLGSFGALLMTDPTQVTIGASGAIYGLMAAAFVIARHRGIDGIASQIGLFVVLNLVFTFSVPGISIGGHIGGLIGGAIAALLLEQIAKHVRGRNRVVLEVAAIIAIAALSVIGALWAAGQGSQTIG